MATKNLQNLRKNNETFINQMHPNHRATFRAFLDKCFNAGFPVWIFSSLRSYSKQEMLYNRWRANPKKYSRAAKPGRSLHNFGLAIDVLVYDYDKQLFVRERKKYQSISSFAQTFNIRWLGKSMGDEIHHFDLDIYNIKDLVELKNNGRVDAEGFVLLSEIGTVSKSKSLVRSEIYSTELGSDLVSVEEEEQTITEKPRRKTITNIEKRKANGIWQIIKLAADQYSLSQTVNDATIAHNQGSLFNFIQNVVQEPWLQFFGETIGNQYYFCTRKEPFDYNGFTNLPVQDTIFDEFISEDLSWYDGPIFSWYQIIPRGSFLGEQNLIFAYVTAVFFEEYADIWGSKPNVQVSNYINFTKFSGKSTLFEKALEDLRYLVESNAYLPFTRQGTISIPGRSDLKRGYRIHFLATNEIFYVDAISQKYNTTEEGIEWITVLKVSRGVKREYLVSPKDEKTKSYFNIINFGKEPNKKVEAEKTIAPIEGSLNVFFDNDRGYLISLEEKFQNFGVDLKMVEQIEKFPNLRTELKNSNDTMLDICADLVKQNFQFTSFRCVGYIDSDDRIGSTAKRLSNKRANCLRTKVLERYFSKYGTENKAEIEAKISVAVNYSGAVYNPTIINENRELEEQIFDDSIRKKAFSRYADFQMDGYIKKEIQEQPSEELGWHVNREVFNFFLNRKQNGTIE